MLLATLTIAELLLTAARDLRVALVLGVVLLVQVGLWGWVLARGFRRVPPGVLRLTLLDARGIPNGVLLTVALAVVMMAVCTLVGLASGRWAPAYVWAGWFGIAAWGIGADALVTGLTPTAYTQQAYGVGLGAGYGSGAAPMDYDGPTAAPSPSPLPADAA